MNAVVPVGPKSGPMVCPCCKATIRTKVKNTTTIKTHFMAWLLCVFGCICLACIPYCMDSCRNADHYCPSCESYIGTYRQ